MKETDSGFSLVEVLVVVIIVAIAAAISIPNLLASRRAASRASAINSLRTIHTAQSTYFSTIGRRTSYADLVSLRGSGLVDASFEGPSFVKSGYTIGVSVTEGANGYCSSADPIGTGTARSLGNDEDGVIYQGVPTNPCDHGLLTIGEGAPINEGT